jgi:hypothetical protein
MIFVGWLLLRWLSRASDLQLLQQALSPPPPQITVHLHQPVIIFCRRLDGNETNRQI